MEKRRIIKEDGRYLVFYSFACNDEAGREVIEDVRAEMEPGSRGMGRDGHSQARPDVQTP